MQQAERAEYMKRELVIQEEWRKKREAKELRKAQLEIRRLDNINKPSKPDTPTPHLTF